MKRSRFGDEQIIAISKVQEAGMTTAEGCRKHGISSATFYNWKSRYGGLVAPRTAHLFSFFAKTLNRTAVR